MDLMDLQTADAPVWFTLTHPATGADLEHDGKPVRLSLHSPDGAVMRADENSWGQRLMTAASRGKGMNLTAEEVEARATQRAIVAVAGWENLAMGGVVVEFSTDKARELIGDPRLRWLRDWVTEKVNDRGNFIGAPAPLLKK